MIGGCERSMSRERDGTVIFSFLIAIAATLCIFQVFIGTVWTLIADCLQRGQTRRIESTTF